MDEKGLTEQTADQIGLLVKERGPPLEILSKLRQEGSKFLENDESVSALNELEILFKALEASKCINRVVFDLSIARGLDYYTGVIFEAVFKGETQVFFIYYGNHVVIRLYIVYVLVILGCSLEVCVLVAL